MRAKLSAVELEEALLEMRKYLPKQGPLENFVHLNILRDFEDINFHEAISKVSHLKQSKSYLDLATYAQKMQEGRIYDSEIERQLVKYPKLQADLTEAGAGLGLSAFELFKRIVLLPSHRQNKATIQWQIRRHGGAELWQRVVALSRDLVVERTTKRRLQFDPRLLARANEVTADFLAAYFDKGVANWRLCKAGSLVETFIASYLEPDSRLPRWLRQFRLVAPARAPVIPTQRALTQASGPSGIPLSDPQAWATFNCQDELSNYLITDIPLNEIIYEILRDVEGWAGLVCFYESSDGSASLLDFLTLRLLIFKALGVDQSAHLHTSLTGPHLDALRLKVLLLVHGLGYQDVRSISSASILPIFQLLLTMKSELKRRILHQAYENSYYTQVAASIWGKAKIAAPAKAEGTPTFSAIFCIDDREESMRRHLEEIDGNCATYGYAGFFNMLMGFQSSQAQHATPLCPINAKPEFLVQEKVLSESFLGRIFQKPLLDLRRLLFTKTLALGILLNFSLFFVTVFADFIRFLSPAFVVRWLKIWEGFLSQHTAMDVATPSSDENKFSDEIASHVIRMLKTIGITGRISDLIIVLGHGSTSANNPHLTAYACGACGGRDGGPNARVFAALANDPKIRAKIRAQGYELPDSAWFVGAYHNTCVDSIDFFDVPLIPARLRESFETCVDKLQQACLLNSQERARRFENVPFGQPKKSAAVLQRRAFMHAEPRAEIGHASNAVCVVGRREISKGIFLDRRAFLCSYDPDHDSDGAILMDLLKAAVPVCLGINLDYYFSFLDNEKFGAGTKLPHNITSYLGVINGTTGDLRVGLPWQAVELHEPMRLLLIVEAPLARVQTLRERLPYVYSLVQKEWLFLAIYDRELDDIQYLHKESLIVEGRQPKFAKTSAETFWGKRHHLEPVLVGEL